MPLCLALSAIEELFKASARELDKLHRSGERRREEQDDKQSINTRTQELPPPARLLTTYLPR